MSDLKQKFNQLSLQLAGLHPRIWAFGWHTQLALFIIFSTASFGLAWLIPNNLYNIADAGLWFGLSFILVVCWWIFIIYRLLKYNADKTYGNRSISDNFLELPTYIIQLSLPLLVSYIFAITLNYRVSSLIPDQSRQTINALLTETSPFVNSAVNTFEYFANDEEYLQQYNRDRQYYNSEKEITHLIKNHSDQYTAKRPLLYPVRVLNYQLSMLPSESKKIPLREYFVKYKNDGTYIKNKLSQLEITLVGLGYNSIKGSAERFYHDFKNHTYQNTITSSANNIKSIKKTINQINDAQKHEAYFFDNSFIYFWINVLVAASILIACFKNMSWKEFLLGLFIIGLTMIVTSIIAAVASVGSEGFGVLYLFLLFLFFTYSFFVINQPYRELKSGVALVFLTCILAVLPIVLFAIGDIFFKNAFAVEWHKKEDYYLYTSVVQIILYITLTYPLIVKPILLNHLSKPED